MENKICWVPFLAFPAISTIFNYTLDLIQGYRYASTIKFLTNVEDICYVFWTCLLDEPHTGTVLNEYYAKEKTLLPVS